ncbi:MAG: alpha/beta fold hydrolase [Alphaproteobacteria bacterium]
MEPRIERVRIDRLDFHVRIFGDGPPILLLHGFPDSGEVWRLQAPALAAAGFRVVVPDLRGCGRTDAPAGVRHYRMDRLVADVFALAAATAPEHGRIDLVGHDWGAAVGWFACMAAPDRIRRFAALSVGHPEAYRRAGLRQKLKGWYLLLFVIPGLAERTLAAGRFRALTRQAPTPADAERWVRDLARPGRLTAGLNWYRAAARGGFWTRAAPVRVPTLGIYGTRDPALAEDQMTNSARWVDAEWRYQRLDGVGHWLQIEAADEVNAHLIDWFGATDASA